jgi:hypothetical protein
MSENGLTEYECPKCGESITSDSDPTCPNCGASFWDSSTEDEDESGAGKAGDPLLPHSEQIQRGRREIALPAARLGSHVVGAVLTALAVPLFVLNLLGGIVGAGWFLLLWQLRPVMVGVLCLFSHMLLAIALAPSLVLAVPMSAAFERRRIGLVAFLSLIVHLYTYALIGTWCIIAFYAYLRMSGPGSLVPGMLMAYSVATGPWAFMASKEEQSGDETSTFAALIAELACATAVVMILVFGAPFSIAATTLGGIAGAGAVLRYIITFSSLRKQARAEELRPYAPRS